MQPVFAKPQEARGVGRRDLGKTLPETFKELAYFEQQKQREINEALEAVGAKSHSNLSHLHPSNSRALEPQVFFTDCLPWPRLFRIESR